MSQRYHHSARQQIPAPPEQVWDFISSPQNLQQITPPEMRFRPVEGTIPERMHAGMVICYALQPLPGISMRWVSEITEVQEGIYFIDEQRSGPFAYWHHEHRIEAIDGGTLMLDELSYRIPLGFLGDLAQLLFVRRKLKQVFDFRYRRIEALFGSYPAR